MTNLICRLPPASLRRLPVLALLPALLTLAACGSQGGYDHPGDGALLPELFDSVPGPDGKPLPPPTVADLAADPGRFKGLAAHDVKAALGDPSYRRRESPAEVWQYYGPGCVLDLFIYDDRGSPRVAHAELRNRSAGQNADGACLSQLLAGKRGQTS